MASQAQAGLVKASPRDKPARSERPRTVSEAAEELGLSVHTIRAWIASRRLSHLRLGRAIRIPAAELRRIIEESSRPKTLSPHSNAATPAGGVRKSPARR
jgi:excisionase family DNA binding protein